MKLCGVSIFVLLLVVASLNIVAQPQIISSSGPDTTGNYQIAEYIIELNATFVNPYDAAEVLLQGFFISPSGDTSAVDGFYMKPYTLIAPDTLSAPGDPQWRVRFAPENTGLHTCYFSLTDQTGSVSTAMDTLMVIPSQEKGFLSFNDNYLYHSDGSPFIGVGENMCWVANYRYSDFDRWSDSLVANHCNFVRVWFTVYTFQIEWNTSGPVGTYTGRLHQAWWLDWFLELMQQKGIKVQLCLNETQAFITSGFPSWDYNPYSVTQGGPCTYPWEFFINEDARNFYKRRLRYIVARWGAYSSLALWELFNEVNGVEGYDGHENEVGAWHNEMANYLNEIDNYDRPVSTSYLNNDPFPNVWPYESIDFTQAHSYSNDPHQEYVNYRITSHYLSTFDKPTAMAEINISHSPTTNIQYDPNGVHIHNSAWGALFSGSFVSALPWYWEHYVDGQNLYYQFAGAGNFAKHISHPVLLQRTLPQTSTDPGLDFDVLPGFTQSFVKAPENYFTIYRNGIMSPESDDLGATLYGYGFNFYRNPPHFIVDYDAPGTFSVTTGETALFSKIKITIDGATYLSQTASPNTTYSISVPAGDHTILCENTGNGYMNVESYNFGDYAANIRCYALQSDTAAYGWVHHLQYNYQELYYNGIPDPVASGDVNLGNYAPGYYFLDRYSGDEGTFISRDVIVHQGGELEFTIQNLQHDMGFILRKQSSAIQAGMSVTDTVVCVENGVFFSDTTQGIYTQRKWIFEGGSPPVSSNKNLYIYYNNPGVYDVTLIHSNAFTSDTVIYHDLIHVESSADTPAGISIPGAVCFGENNVTLLGAPVLNASSYGWVLPPACSGSSDSTTLLLTLAPDFIADNVGYYAVNNCGSSDTVYAALTITPAPELIDSITGPDKLCTNVSGYFSVPEIENASFYTWSDGYSHWDTEENFASVQFSAPGNHTLTVQAKNDCGQYTQAQKTVFVKNPVVFPGLIAGESQVFHSQSNTPFHSAIIPNAEEYLWTFPDGFHSNSATMKNINLAFDNSAASGWVTCRGVNVCGPGPESSFFVDVTPLPAGWNPLWYGAVHTVSTIDNLPVFLDGEALSGDYVLGVFYSSGSNLECGGAVPSSFLNDNDFQLYADDVQTNVKDGFYTGDSLVWMLYSADMDVSCFAEVEYFYGPEHYTPGGTSVITEVNATLLRRDSVLIPQGWSGLSSYIIPDDTLVESLFSGVVENLIILKTVNGLVFWPPWSNTIISWDEKSGYRTKFEEPRYLVFEGKRNTDKSLSLNEGWSEIPVPANNPVDVDVLFSPASDTVIIVKESAGNGVFWPAVGVNTLGLLYPGKAYLMKTTHPLSFAFPADTLFPGGFSNEDDKTIPFVPPSPVNHMFVFSNNALKSVSGDEIVAVSPDGNISGRGFINGDQLSIAVYGGEGLFSVGEAVVFKCPPDTTCYVSVDKNNNVFSWNDNGYSFVSGLQEVSYSAVAEGNEILPVVTVHPNPAIHKTWFTIFLPEKLDDAVLSVYSSEGMLVTEITVTSEQQTYLWKAVAFPPGVYHYELITIKQRITGKVVLR